MNSYVITERITVTRQEGDTGSLGFIVPAVLNPALFTIKLQVWTVSNKSVMLFEKTTWTVSSQTITAPMAALDTKGYAGTHRWEMEFRSLTEIITVGKGDFVIENEIIK